MMETVVAFFASNGLALLKNITVAGLIVLLGLYVSKYVVQICGKAMEKANIEPTLITFLKSLIGTALKLFIAFTALTVLGFPTGSLIAVFGTVGAALALGFKDSLGSFVSGIIILFTRPFLKGDFVEVSGQAGVVKEIQIMSTILLTGDNRVVSIPNSQMTGSVIVNSSKEDKRRVDIDFGVSYSSDVEKAKNLISKVVTKHELALKDPEHFVRVTNYEDSAIIITLRVWCENANYWNLKFDLLEQIKAEFDANGIEIPFNQLDVTIKQ